MNLEHNLMNARCRLLTDFPWYGAMAQLFHWKPDPKIRTMGVRVLTGGKVECTYSQEWCSKLSLDELQGLIQHEIEHIVRLHTVRVGGRNFKLWNIATDMVINGTEKRPKISNLPSGSPEKDGIYYPEDWDPNLSAEEVYARLESIRVVIYSPSAGGSGGSGGEGDQEILGDADAEETLEVHGQTHDDHEPWQNNTASEDEVRQTVKEMVRQASTAAGNAPGHMLEAIKALEKPVVSWRHELRNQLGRQTGGKRPTWARQNRRQPVFGMKGRSTHARIPLIVCTDTSASMDEKRLSQAWSEIESCSTHYKITAVQFDHGYQCHQRYHRGDWKKIEVKGRGGTSFIELFNALEEKQLVGRMVVVITDGEAAYPEPKPYPVMWIVIPHIKMGPNNTPPWGKVIKIEK